MKNSDRISLHDNVSAYAEAKYAYAVREERRGKMYWAKGIIN